MAALLLPGIRGTNSDPQYYATTRNREVGGPFESSGSTSRYILTEVLAKEGRITFNAEEAQFASPDVAGTSGRYFSLFMPGLSFAAVPFYNLGKIFNAAQIGAFSLNLILAILNALLIAVIVHKMTGGRWTGLFSGAAFLFATNAFSYSYFFSQHHLGAFCTLSLVLIYLMQRNLITNMLAGFIYGYAIFADIPNAIILFPLMLGIFLTNFSLTQNDKKLSLKVKTAVLGLVLGLIPMLFVLGSYNKSLTNSYTNLPQFIGRTPDFTVEPEKELAKKTKDEVSQFDHNSPFFSRFVTNGIYILIFSNERGWLVYAPIALLGILGLFAGLKKEETSTFMQILLGTVLINLLLYAMFGDPWGGWSFGARYMIPAAAIMTILVGYAAAKYKEKIVFSIILLVLLTYGVFINTLGAITTAQIPPKQESIHLTSPVPYTYAYNLQLIDQNQTRSYMYTTYLRDKISVKQFYTYYTMVLLTFVMSLYVLAVLEKTKKL